MSTLEETLDYLQPEEVDARVAELKASFDFEQGNYANLTDLRRLFSYIRHLIYIREFEDAADVLHKTRDYLTQALEEHPDHPVLLNLWIDWNELAMRFVLPEPDQFAEYPFYADIRETCEGRDRSFQLRDLQNQLTLLNHYNNWIQAGGNTEILDETVRAEMTLLSESALDNILLVLDEWKADNDIPALVSMKRSLLRHYTLNNQPKEAVLLLKELLEELPEHPDFQVSDLADLNIEIGSIFLNYNKFKQALPYLEEARDLYEEAGEAFEVHASQADALVQECLQKELE